MFQWRRLPDADAAGTASNDTTEIQIGAGITVPDWAKSIIAAHIHPIYLALTTDEEVSGYVRVADDKNTIDPLNFPLPIAQCLTGALGTHLTFPVTFPCFHNIEKNDTLRLYAALDAATTGIHTLQGYLLLSDQPAPFNMKAEKSAVVAASTTANTAGATTAISTIAGRTKDVIGLWEYVVAGGGITAAQTVGGYIKVSSNERGWIEQRIPTNIQPSGLGTQIHPITKPVICILPELFPWLDGYHPLPFLTPYPLNTKGTINFTSYMDGTNTAAPTTRFGLIWRE